MYIIWKTLCSQLHACAYKMPNLKRDITLTKINPFVFSKVHQVICSPTLISLLNIKALTQTHSETSCTHGKLWWMNEQMNKAIRSFNFFRSWGHITKTCLLKYTENFTTKKKENVQIKKSDIFHISAQNIDCGYSLEPPRYSLEPQA